MGVLCVAVVGVAAQWVAWRLRLPAIVLLFAAGLLAGPVLGLLHPSAGAAGAAAAAGRAGGGDRGVRGRAGARRARTAGGGRRRAAADRDRAADQFRPRRRWPRELLTGMGWGPASLYGAITVVTGPDGGAAAAALHAAEAAGGGLPEMGGDRQRPDRGGAGRDRARRCSPCRARRRRARARSVAGGVAFCRRARGRRRAADAMAVHAATRCRRC